jgi:hypothetical protein
MQITTEQQKRLRAEEERKRELANREDVLKNAQDDAEAAATCIREHEAWLTRANQITPPPYGMTRAQRDKERRDVKKVMERLRKMVGRPHELKLQWAHIDEARKRKEEENEKLQRAAREEKEREAVIAEAINWLTDNTDKRLGIDYSVGEAIRVANDVALEQEIKVLEATRNTWYKFDGQNCVDPCAGWDGRSRRCECGNRRVEWVEGLGHSFKHPHAEAVTY